MIKIKLLSDYPYCVAFGGKEIQSIQYYESLKDKIDVSFLDIYSKDALIDVDILHLFGHSQSFYNIVKHARIKYPNLKIILSPTFYTDKPISYLLASKIGFLIPFSNLFKDIHKLSQLSDLIIVNSDPERFQFSKFFKVDLKKINVIFNGVESDFTKNIVNNQSELINLGIDSSYILSVGFFDERKNTFRLVKSFLKSKASEDVKLVLVGEPRFSNVKHNDEFAEIVKKSRDKIIITGVLNRDSLILKSLYNNALFHILPSHLETPGISNVEALMYGKNIVVGDCDPVRSYFKEYAFYCNPKSSKSISDAIDEMSIMKLYSSYDLNKFAVDNFSLSSISQKLLFNYLEVVNK